MKATRYISTLTGSTFINFVRALIGNKPPIKFYPKLSLSAGISMLVSGFAPIEKMLFRRQAKAVSFQPPPLFIIGHWRSGTTFLHNLLSQDPQFAYFTTYQSLFPHTALLGQHIFKPFIKGILPKHRPVDGIKLAADFPQEEEFALGNMNPYCFYYWWYFPDKLREYYRKYVLFEGISQKAEKQWNKDYRLLASKAMLNTDGQILLSKNPPNSARISVLNKLFPGARFLHIYRNPVEVYLSTKKFFLSTLPDLALNDYREEDIIDDIFYLYRNLMHQLIKQSKLLDEAHIVSIRYEDFVADPMSAIESLYQQFNLHHFALAKPRFKQYIRSQTTHRTGQYSIRKSELNRIMDEWGFAMDAFNYKIPKDIKVH